MGRHDPLVRLNECVPNSLGSSPMLPRRTAQMIEGLLVQHLLSDIARLSEVEQLE